MVWSEDYWNSLEQQTRSAALAARSESVAWELIVRQARHVLKSYSTSFFIVTRFLPPPKRARVEAIYAAVRYPDEIVDTFRLPPGERDRLLDEWSDGYELGLDAGAIHEALNCGVPVFLASFCKVVNECGIPPEHYRAFIDAMRHDVRPRRFGTLDDLIDNYIYGSAIVVGYFLTYVYGAATPVDFERALGSARALGIALQLTNFLRDVSEDQRRGRLYLPLDLVRGEGIDEVDTNDRSQHPALARVLQRLTVIADDYYAKSLADLDAFAADSRVAIRACIDVYGQLNAQIARSRRGILHRESVPMTRKFRVLPTSKYWRLPLEYLRA
ncbi:MAG TPA: phytoene/squalene synthase family protein [Blastocatellia bacterium]|nr:phytoene/squalene synthase family protein [Blastocatellia bacterium]